MFKFSKKIFFVLFCISFSFLDSYTNKTYLRQLDNSFYFPITPKFSQFVVDQKEKKLGRSDLSLSAFYYQSTNGSDLGRYFGANDKNNVVVSNIVADLDVWLDYLVHQGEQINPQRKAELLLDPKTTQYGLNISYRYDLSKILKNFYIQANVPIIRVENDLRMKFSSSGYLVGEDSEVVKEYLAGDYENLNIASLSMQSALTKAKIKGKQSRSGVSDLNFALGYKVLDEKNIASVLALRLFIPTGNKTKGEYLFEPVLPDEAHFALALNWDNSYRLWADNYNNLNLIFDLNYKYFFQNTQKRTLGIKGPHWFKTVNWGQYYLLGKNGDINEPLTPAANVLTQNVSVRPGSQFDGGLKLLFNISDFNIGLGGRVLFKEEEGIKLKDSFPENTYGVAAYDYQTNVAFDVNQISEDFQSLWLNENDIDKSVTQAPFLFAYQFYGEAGYFLKTKSCCDFALNLGGGYNFVSQNNSFEGWLFNLRLDTFF